MRRETGLSPAFRSPVALTAAIIRELQYRIRLAGARADGALLRGMWIPVIVLMVVAAALLSLGAFGIRLLLA